MISKNKLKCMKCSLTIKKIPKWINKNTTVKVQQVDEEEAVGASMLGLTVFRDSIYENGLMSHKKETSKRKRRKSVQSKIKKLLHNPFHNHDADSNCIEEESSDNDIGINNSSLRFPGFLEFPSCKLKQDFSDIDDIKSDPNYNVNDTFSFSDSDSDDSFCVRLTKRRKFSLKSNQKICSNFKAKNKKTKNYSNNKNMQNINIKNVLHERSSFVQKLACSTESQVESNNFLIPVVKKFETTEEMERRHNQVLGEARKTYNRIVNKVLKEKKLKELELSLKEKYKDRFSESLKFSDLHFEEKRSRYLCPFYFCAVPIENPLKHLNEHHKIGIAEEDKNLYVEAAKEIKYVRTTSKTKEVK